MSCEGGGTGAGAQGGVVAGARASVRADLGADLGGVGSGAAPPPAQGGEAGALYLEEVRARIVWSYLALYNAHVARSLVQNLGAVDALNYVRELARGDAGSRGAGARTSAFPTPPRAPRAAANAAAASAAGAAAAASAAASATASVVPPTLPQQQLTKAVQKWEELLARINPDVVLEEVQRAGAEVIIPQSPQWLETLQSLGDSTPLILYARGNVAGLPSACQKAVALVGARACSSYGRQVAVELAADLGGMGFCIISGGAVGIDASAHTGALGHSNIAFLPTGIDACYPRTNEPLFDKMLANGGTLLTEYPPNTSVAGFRFLERNRLIAGLAGGTVVVEASWRSGAISTANHTMEIGKPLGAVPGSVNSSTSAGCHKLIREYGATLITEAEDVREMLNNEVDLMSMVAREEAKNKKYARKFDDLPKLQRDIMHELERHNSCSTAKISDNLAIPQPEIVVEITKLQLLGLVEPSKRAGQYKRRKVQQRK